MQEDRWYIIPNSYINKSSYDIWEIIHLNIKKGKSYDIVESNIFYTLLCVCMFMRCMFICVLVK